MEGASRSPRFAISMESEVEASASLNQNDDNLYGEQGDSAGLRASSWNVRSKMVVAVYEV